MPILFLLLAASAQAFEAPSFTPNVVDEAGVLSVEEVAELNHEIAVIREQSKIFAAVLLVGTIAPTTIEDAAERTFKKWRLGQKEANNGLLIIAAIEDRKIRIEVGYGLEPSIPDAKARQVIETAIVPRFKKLEYAAGLKAALQISSDLVLRGDSIQLKEEHLWDIFKERFSRHIAVWFGLIILAPVLFRLFAVLRARGYPAELAPSSQEASLRRIVFLSGGSVGLSVFLMVNPGIFYVLLSATPDMAPFAPGFVLFAYLFLAAVNGGYIAMLRPGWRKKFLARPARKGGSSGSAQAFEGGMSSSSSSGDSSSSSSSDSSSSSGGSSGGGGASSSW